MGKTGKLDFNLILIAFINFCCINKQVMHCTHLHESEAQFLKDFQSLWFYMYMYM